VLFAIEKEHAMIPKLTVEQVKTEVCRFWNAFASKDSQTLVRFYSVGATVFNSASGRYELGLLSTARREREYFQRNTKIKVDLGEIHVAILGEHAESAVASYTFHFQATNLAMASGGVEDIPQGRASHVFAYDADGNLCIMHEHLSIPAKSIAVTSASHSSLDNANAASGKKPVLASSRAS
jgi:ketosteroid isomerase-like protein